MSTRSQQQTEALTKLWYEFGNQGPQHSIGNHKWIQKLIFDPQCDANKALAYYQEKFPSDGGKEHTKMITSQCIDAVNKVIS